MFTKYDPYVIAEIGVNHEGNLVLAKRLINLAKEGGAHAAKFQSYKAEKIAAKNSPAYWDTSKEKTTSQFELFKKYDSFDNYEYEQLAAHCRQVGIDFLSTPFDLEAVDFLDPLMPFFKVASADLTNRPLLKKVASKGKPVVLSTGSSRIGEIGMAVEFLQGAGCKEIVLLHCVLNYPTKNEDAHLDMILGLKDRFPDLRIGYSDHTVPDDEMTSLTLAYVNGASVIEKHFTHDKSLPGNDHYHAMTASDLSKFFVQVEKIKALKGQRAKVALAAELPARLHARRSVVTRGPIKVGERLTEQNTICKRPAHGISPVQWEKVIGTVVVRDLEDDHILQWGDLEMPKQKVVAVVQARTGSKRFPGKMLEKLGDLTLLEWVLMRLQKSQQADQIVLATSDQPADDALASIAKNLNIDVFRGSESDVVDRIYKCALQHHADAVVRVCADNPFVDPGEVDRLISEFRKGSNEYAYNHVPRNGNQYPDGFGAEIFSMDLMTEIWKFAKGSEREHLTLYIWNNEYGISIGVIGAPEELRYPNLKFDIDEPQQLKKLSELQVNLHAKASEIVQRSLEIWT